MILQKIFLTICLLVFAATQGLPQEREQRNVAIFLYQGVEVLENTRFVDNGNIVTTAGVSAGIDSALHVISKMLGEDVAHETARYMEYDKWQPDAGFIIEPAELLSPAPGKNQK